MAIIRERFFKENFKVISKGTYKGSSEEISGEISKEILGKLHYFVFRKRCNL